MNLVKTCKQDIETLLETVQIEQTGSLTKLINTNYKANTKAAKYLHTAYNVHKADFTPEFWGLLFMAVIELLGVLEKHFTDKEGKFRTPIFLGWLPVITAIVRFLKSVVK